MSYYMNYLTGVRVRGHFKEDSTIEVKVSGRCLYLDIELGDREVFFGMMELISDGQHVRSELCVGEADHLDIECKFMEIKL